MSTKINRLDQFINIINILIMSEEIKIQNTDQSSISQLKQANIFLSILVVILAVAFGFNIYQTKFSIKPINTNANFSTIEKEVQDIIKQRYLRDIPDQKKYEEFKLKGEVASLGDPYSEYLTKQENSNLQSDLNQRFVGIGIKVEKIAERFTVVGLIKNSPAQAIGIQGGDVLIKVDDFLVLNSSLDELVTKIRGVEGTNVKIELARGSEIKDFDITRKEVKNELINLDFKDKYAVITVSSFGDSLGVEMEKISQQILSKPEIEKIIIDVRTNTGGLLDQSVQLMSYFVPENTQLVSEKSKDSNGKQLITPTFSIKKEQNLIKYPVIVLTDKLTASASEILTAVMKEKRDAKVIGEKTFGKGVVQVIYPVSNGDSIKLTIAEWLTPNGKNIDKTGIEPDIKIKEGENALELALKQ
jgi:carboxyl-terminal processing protease